MSTSLLSPNLVSLTLPSSSSSVQINLFGATITSWKSQNQERLFLSSKSNLDGQSPIRGGIPIVFPVFGEVKDHKDLPKGKGLEALPRHGFARNSTWSLSNEKVHDEAQGGGEKVSVALVLKSTSIHFHFSTFKYPFILLYTITLTSTSLSTSLKVTHDSTSTSSSMPFQALLHSYIALPDSTKASISGLQGQYYHDKTSADPSAEIELTSQELTTQAKEIDSVFPGHSPEVKISYCNSLIGRAKNLVQAHTTEGGNGIKLTREGFKDTVVWNPAKEKSDGMGDMEDGGWKKFVCVEPGYVDGWVELEEGESWEGKMILEVY